MRRRLMLPLAGPEPLLLLARTRFAQTARSGVGGASPPLGASQCDQPIVSLRPAVPEELPRTADVFDHVEVARRDDELVLVLARGREEVAPRVDDVRRPVEAADVPRRLGADAVARGDEVAIRDGVRGLLELPEILREAGDRRRRVEDDLGAVQAQRTRALGLSLIHIS